MSEKSVKKEQEKVADEKPKTNVEADESAAQNSEEAKKASEASVKEKPSEPDWKALYALTLADFDNYKKRAARDREDTYHYAEADILRDVLPSVDNLQLALDNAKDKVGDPFVDGVRLVAETLLKALKDHGAEPFDSVGKPLDTERMEAIATLPSAEIAEGLVSIESKKGWTLRGKVLRAAQVVVSSGAPGGAEAANG
jgi:molecular chaperone GrpE